MLNLSPIGNYGVSNVYHYWIALSMIEEGLCQTKEELSVAVNRALTICAHHYSLQHPKINPSVVSLSRYFTRHLITVSFIVVNL